MCTGATQNWRLKEGPDDWSLNTFSQGKGIRGKVNNL